MLNKQTEKKVKELAEWFCDNPNYSDIEEALIDFARELMLMYCPKCDQPLNVEFNKKKE